MGLNDQIETALDTLKALYYLTQGLQGEAGAHEAKVRNIYQLIPRSGRRELLDSLKRDIALVRDHYGSLAPNRFYRDIVNEARKAKSGLIYISKWRIESELFSRYERSLPRWPHIKLHALVVFDPHLGHLNQVFELDGQLFHDAEFLLQKARQVQAGAKIQRHLPPSRHRILHSLLRPIVTALFNFVEAYLNGIAFDCFQKHHDELDLADHDLLGEWNSAQKRRKFVAFDQKVFKYPTVVAKTEGREIDLSACKSAHRIVQSGKELRDAITHPSAQFDPQTHVQKKITLLAGLTLPELESLYTDICEYVRFVEEGLGHEVKESAPWRFDGYGFTLAKDESI